MGCSPRSRGSMSETRKYRKFTAQQKTEIVLASLRGPKSVAELCREHEISDSLLRKWRDQFLAAGAEASAGQDRAHRGRRAAWPGRQARTRVGPQDDGGGGRGGTLAGLGVSVRVARSRELVAQGRPEPPPGRPGRRDQPPGDLPPPAAPAARAPPPAGRAPSASSWRVARERTRPTARGWSPRSRRGELGRRGQPQARAAADARAPAAAAPSAAEGRRRRPGYFQRRRARIELWHLDMTSVWVAEHGWCLSERRDRLLHPRDHRLGARRPLPRAARRSRSSTRAVDRARHPRRAS